jgi:hypothetical protein
MRHDIDNTHIEGNGILGQGCSHSIHGNCDFVFGACSTKFAILIFQILLYALELKSCAYRAISFYDLLLISRRVEDRSLIADTREAIL